MSHDKEMRLLHRSGPPVVGGPLPGLLRPRHAVSRRVDAAVHQVAHLSRRGRPDGRPGARRTADLPGARPGRARDRGVRRGGHLGRDHRGHRVRAGRRRRAAQPDRRAEPLRHAAAGDPPSLRPLAGARRRPRRPQGRTGGDDAADLRVPRAAADRSRRGGAAPRNSYGDKGALPGWYRALRRPALIRLMHKLPTEQLGRVRTFVSRRISKPVERPEPSEESLARLRTVLAPEVEDLRALTGLPFSGWSV